MYIFFGLLFILYEFYITHITYVIHILIFWWICDGPKMSEIVSSLLDVNPSALRNRLFFLCFCMKALGHQIFFCLFRLALHLSLSSVRGFALHCIQRLSLPRPPGVSGMSPWVGGLHERPDRLRSVQPPPPANSPRPSCTALMAAFRSQEAVRFGRRFFSPPPMA